MDYKIVSRKTRPVNQDSANAFLVCPRCGYSKIRLPVHDSVWREYQQQGLVDIQENVVDVAYVIARSDADYLKGMALYIPAVVTSLVLFKLGVASFVLPLGTVTIGASLLYLIAARHRLIWGEPEPEPTKPEPELPAVTEVSEPRSLFRFSKSSVAYRSGDPVPDYYLWRMADAYKRGVPFSRQMWTGETKVVSRPAFQALRDAFVSARIAYHDGQDVALTARGKNVLGQWAALDCPAMPIEKVKTGRVKAHSPTF